MKAREIVERKEMMYIHVQSRRRVDTVANLCGLNDNSSTIFSEVWFTVWKGKTKNNTYEVVKVGHPII